jgi:uncharacterized membrane protein SpoIIM required for sporulation
MVIEALGNKDRNLFTFAIAFMYASLGIFIAYILFPDNMSIVAIFLTALAGFYFMHTSITKEEGYDIKIKNEKELIKRHANLIVCFLFFFFGVFACFMVAGLLLPSDISVRIFETQYSSIDSVNEAVRGKALQAHHFSPLFFHNISVLFFFFLFSFIFGAGAIFLLVYNASVGGVFVSQFINSQLAHISAPGALLLGLIRYFPHAVLEFGAYFFGALAGGILSVALVNQHIRTKYFSRILLDSSWLIAIAVIILLFAGFVEVFITPKLVALGASILV